MRTLEEFKDVFAHPTKFLPCDIYKAAFIELYTFLPLSELPESFVQMLSEERKAGWNTTFKGDQGTEEEQNKELDEDIKDEIKYLKRMLKNDVIVPALDRTPRLLALLWVRGYEVDKFDRRVWKIRTTHITQNDLKKKLNGLYIKIERTYNI